MAKQNDLDLLSEEGAKKKAEEVFAAQQEGRKPEGVSSTFVKALAGFLPTIVGAAFGGSQGAAIGSQVGLGALGQINQAEIAQADRQAKLQAQQNQQAFELQKLQQSQEFRREESQLDRDIELQKLGIQQDKLRLTAADLFGKSKDKEEKLTEVQAKARKFADAAQQAENQYIKALGETGFKPGGTSDTLQTAISFLTPKDLEPLLQTEGFERARQAERSFVNSSLRDDSGAALKDDEIEEATTRLFPRPGDSENTIKQKAEARALIVAGLKEKGKILGQTEARSLINAQLEREAPKPSKSTKSDFQERSNKMLQRLRGLNGK